MVRTLNGEVLKEEVLHALGGQHSKRFSTLSVISDALEEVTSMNPWRFLEGGVFYLDTRGQFSFTGQDWDESELTLGLLASGAFANYAFVPNDYVNITGGAGVNVGFHEIASRTDADFIVLKKSIATTPGDLTANDIGGDTDTHTILLPADFRGLIDADFTEEGGSRLELTSPERVAQIRRNQIPLGPGKFWGCFSWVADASAGAPAMRAILEITPTPGSDEASPIQFLYKKCIPELADDRSVVICPPYMHLLIKRVVRAVALGLEKPMQGGDVDERISKIKKMAVFEDALDADGDGQVDVGPIIGGHAPRSDGFHIENIPGDGGLTIGGPSTS